METIHAAFQITRQADAVYIPPGRLRKYDLIILDEVSQMDSDTWTKLQTALGELNPGPFIVFVGDFQQLQPVDGSSRLRDDLRGQLDKGMPYIELQHHEAARSVDPSMLDFLEKIRVEQPSRADLEAFFAGRTWPSDLQAVAKAAHRLELLKGTTFTFLTITNAGADKLNKARLALEFPAAAKALTLGNGIPTEAGTVVAEPGMRMRLTHNVDKDRGFVNGNTGIVRTMLRKDVFVLQSDQGIQILIHPITVQGKKFLPVAYGWATAMRRAQGATLAQVALWFDRRLGDRGYAYVGTSRAKTKDDVYHIGSIRRTDWRPVGEPGPNEQSVLSVLSESTDTEEAPSMTPSSSSAEPDFSSLSSEHI